jgi:hypothetical protein
LLEHLLRVGLEDDALAGAPAPRVHHGVIALGKFIPVVARVEFRTQVDVALGALQGAEIAPDVLGIGRAVDHGGDHEGGVDHLAEAELLDEVIGTAEQRRRPAPALDQELEAAKQHAVLEVEIDLAGREILLQRLDRRIVAAGLEADRDRHPGKVGRRADGRIGRNENARWRHRIGVGIEPGMAVRGRHVHGPMAGAAHVGFAALFDALEGAFRALVVVLAAARADQLAELVVEALGAEISLLLGHPLLQAKVRLDDEFAHTASSRAWRPLLSACLELH